MTPRMLPENPIQKILLSCVGGAITGLFAVLLPALLAARTLSLAQAFARTIEQLSFVQIALLFVVGVVWGTWLGRPLGVLAALSELAALPMIAIAQMIADPTSHNLWPFEFLIYGLLTIPGLVGAVLGNLARRRLLSAA